MQAGDWRTLVEKEDWFGSVIFPDPINVPGPGTIKKIFSCVLLVLFIRTDIQAQVSVSTVVTIQSAKPRTREPGISPGVLPTGPLNAITDVAGVLVGHVTPIILTNTLSVPQGMEAVISWTLTQAGNERVRSVNAILGETNDGFLNDIRGRHLRAENIIRAIEPATFGPVQEGSVGAGTGTIYFGWKGGIGTSSRHLPESIGGHTVGVLVQTNYGGILTIDGVPIGEELGQYYLKNALDMGDADGSIMVVVATDAPLFQAVVEATEEAIYNALFKARTVTGHRGTIEEIPIDEVLEVMQRYGRDVNFVR